MGSKKQNPSEAGRESHASKGSETGNHPKQIRRYSKAKNKALDNLKALHARAYAAPGKEKCKLVGAIDRLTQCGDFLKFRDYYTVEQVRLVKAHFCKQHLLCPLCAIRRASKMIGTYAERIQYLLGQNPRLKASMLTLTVKDSADLLERVQHLQAAMKKLSQTIRHAKHRKKIVSEFGKILGYAGAIEVTRGKGSGLWHPHIHMIVLHEEDFLPALDHEGRERFAIIKKGKRKGQKQIIPALADEWQAMTGDSFVVDVQPIGNPEEVGADLVEVFKYALKFSSMNPAHVVDAWLTLSGKRLVVAGGILWGLKVPKELTDQPLDELPYIELLYRFVGTGYTLEKTTHNPHGDENG